MTTRPWLAAFVLAGAVALGAGCGASAATKTTLPFYDNADFTPRWTTDSAHHIGAFHLVTQTGAPLTDADLLGHVHVANFMFTRCPGPLPDRDEPAEEGAGRDRLVRTSCWCPTA